MHACQCRPVLRQELEVGLSDSIIDKFSELLLGSMAQVKSQARPAKHFQIGGDGGPVLGHAGAQEPDGSFDLVSLLGPSCSAPVGDQRANIWRNIAGTSSSATEALVSIM